MKILPGTDRPTRHGPESYFTGAVLIDELVPPNAPSTAKAVRVTFAPGARTAWHTHPLGQSIHILSGVCFAQSKGRPVQELHAGDTAWFEPNELHWHGATPTQSMVHLAVQQANDQGIDAIWQEHVTEDEYTA